MSTCPSVTDVLLKGQLLRQTFILSFPTLSRLPGSVIVYCSM